MHIFNVEIFVNDPHVNVWLGWRFV